MGEGIVDATLTQWLVSIGDKVEEDQSIAELATDKVDSELPAPADGIIKELLVKDGDIPKVGDTIAILETEVEQPASNAEENTTTPHTPAKDAESSIPEIDLLDQPKATSSTGKQGSRTPKGRFLSPLVRSIAEKEQISGQELDTIRGSSNTGRITKNDVMDYLSMRETTPQRDIVNKSQAHHIQASHPSEQLQTMTAKSDDGFIKQAYMGNYEIIEMDRMRKLIANHMVRSKQISPHVTSFVEADVTTMVNWRKKMKPLFLEQDNIKLTFTPLFIEATAKALKAFPMINVAVDNDKIILRKDINIGMAAALPSGNLIVPVIKNADRQNLLGLSATVNDLAHRARENKLQPDEIQGGTFTITNFGTFGNISGTPIINQPQVAILGIGSIEKKPAVVETAQGDMIAVRHKMILSLAYDHRVVDGALGGKFLKQIANNLEHFNIDRTN